MAETENVLIGKTGASPTRGGSARYWLKEEGSDRFFSTFDGTQSLEFMGREGQVAIVTYETVVTQGNDGRPRKNYNIEDVTVDASAAPSTGAGSQPSANVQQSHTFQEDRQESIQRQTAAKCAAQILTGNPLPPTALGEIAMDLTKMFNEFFATGYWGIRGINLGADVAVDDDIPFDGGS